MVTNYYYPEEVCISPFPSLKLETFQLIHTCLRQLVPSSDKAAGSIQKTESQNIRKRDKSRIINHSFHGLTYNMSAHFAHCLYFSLPSHGSEKYQATCKVYTCAYYMSNHRNKEI